MSDKSREYFQQVKERVTEEDIPGIIELGYDVSPAIGLLEDRLAIILNLSPLEDGTDAPSEDLREKLKQDLTAKYDVPVNVIYLPNGVKKRKQ
ncbi:MAG TPA: hypothetical protein VJA18_05275 [Candidatus Nanoarchaeia archaeon]|nr:hypothetical protein [Candidatus Nanoarchaeia archaeon]